MNSREHLTSETGPVLARDEMNIVYVVTWDDEPIAVYTTRARAEAFRKEWQARQRERGLSTVVFVEEMELEE